MVKKYSSINGIQADIMDYTMNQILSMVNQLTAMIFGGRFVLHKFEITANDFMISFLDRETGIIRPDISMMSASQLAQLSMIISFVLLHNASQKFNIIRLDEVDNNLDNDNRLRFFDLVYTITQILNFHQVVLISHNIELDLTNCDLIITRIQNQEYYRALLNSGANIIADFNR
jgi:chromosome segregation ATPase